ncbi:hypothetical protein M8C21_031167 [Ambrosia artemisiifolia]|uniref:Uncharacterized protein n=1 Tax=Ambrosia artemisiifolia TaxID=4212 RepID=A0AAD5CE54_AMBAR|nr:hypothetical protein M8C21_031167 [Ambrosia artemisiifolia]
MFTVVTKLLAPTRLFIPNKTFSFSLTTLMAAAAFSTNSPSYAPSKRIGTHNGSFHCDEALGCFMLRLTNKYYGAEIVRTRDPQVLETLDAVLDVGGVYDPSQDRYDHHQKGFAEVFGHGFTTKLSSAGLIYKHFGTEIIAKEVQLDEGHPDVHRLYLAIYKSFMESVRFHVKSWLPARSIVMACLAARTDIDPSGEIMVLNRFCPWKLHLYELEQELKIEPSIKYVLYEDERSKGWRVQAVAKSPESFESRKALPFQWRGLRDDELSKETGIPGCVFVHMSGFIGGNHTYEGALAMARGGLKL